jgi:hypothetical protein
MSPDRQPSRAHRPAVRVVLILIAATIVLVAGILALQWLVTHATA